MRSWDRTILVTGGAGFVGGNFVRLMRSIRPEWRIVNYDSLTDAGTLTNLVELEGDEGHVFVHGDIRNRAEITRVLRKCDGVVHVATENRPHLSKHDAGSYISTNVVGTQVLYDACRESRAIERIVHVGTDEVYGTSEGGADRRATEESPLRPATPFAASKASADLLALSYAATFDLPISVTRCCGNFGPHQPPDRMLPLFVTNLLDGRKIPMSGEALAVRDWIHVSDHCEAILAVLEKGSAGEIYNVGGNGEQSELDLIRAVLEWLERDESMIERVAEERVGRPRTALVDASKIQRELGFTPTRSAWPRALAETIKWYQMNEWWWRPLKSGSFNGAMLKKRA